VLVTAAVDAPPILDFALSPLGATVLCAGGGSEFGFIVTIWGGGASGGCDPPASKGAAGMLEPMGVGKMNPRMEVTCEFDD
jgi:hypothetical protein